MSSLFKRLREGIARTRDGLFNRLGRLLGQREPIDASSLEALESALLEADTGVAVTARILSAVKLQAGRERTPLVEVLRAEMVKSLTPVEQALVIPPGLGTPFVILVVGVNGVGKTTTIAKLGRRLQEAGHKVMFAAGDTFRAAAVEQLKTWGERLSIPVIAQGTGADPASVVFDAYTAAAMCSLPIPLGACTPKAG